MVDSKNLAKFKSRSTNELVIEVLGQQETYEIIKFFEFTSERKMMSVLVRQILPEGKGPLLLFTKGADSVIKDLCV